MTRPLVRQKTARPSNRKRFVRTENLPNEPCVVYRLTVGDQTYIGGSTRAHSRWNEHLDALAEHRHDSAKLQGYYDHFGRENTRLEILEHCTAETVGAAETRHIQANPGSVNIQQVSNLQQSARQAPQKRGRAPAGMTPVGQPVLNPRQNQKDADRALQDHMKLGRGMIKSPCGTGKTKMAAYMARHFHRTLFITHTNELVDSSVQAFMDVWPGHDVGVLQQKESGVNDRFVIASMATLRRRLPKIGAEHFDFIVMDEAHLSGTAGADRVLDHFRPKFLLAVTATPERQQGTSLEELYARVLYELSTPEAIRMGLITPLKVRTFDLMLRTPGGEGEDFCETKVSRIMNTAQFNALIAEQTRAHAGRRPTLVFAANIRHAQALAEAFGPGAEAVWGSDRDRAGKIKRFQQRVTQFLISVKVIGYGFDAPHASCLAMAFMTKNQVRYTQTIGRVMRTSPGKEDALLLDFGGNHARGMRVEKHWDFEVDHLDPLRSGLPIPASTRPMPLDDLPWGSELTVTVRDVADALRPIPKKRAMRIRPEPATRNQKWQLANRFGYRLNDNLTMGHASALIRAQPPTAGQRQELLNFGFPGNDPSWNYLHAKEIIEQEQKRRARGSARQTSQSRPPARRPSAPAQRR